MSHGGALIAMSFAGMLAAGPALAGDWAGVYFGAGLDGVFADSGTKLARDFTVIDEFGSYSVTSAGRTSDHGSAAGVAGFIGLNALYGRLLVGGELGGTLTDLDLDSRVAMTTEYPDGTVCVCVDRFGLQSDWSVSAIGRVGTLAGNNTLIYALGGLTYAGFEIKDFEPLEGATFEKVGFTLGGGIEQKVSKRVSLRGEYRFTDFGTHTARGQTRESFRDGDFSFEIVTKGKAALDMETHVIRAGLALSLQ